MHPKASHLSLPLIFGLCIAIPAVNGISTTQLPDAGLSPLTGTYQRAYEDRFSAGFPLSDLASHTLTAATLALFGQSGPDVVIGDNNWLFTAEEFRPPAQTFDLLTQVQKAKEAMGPEITLIPVIVPDKARIYADKLPRPRGQALEARYDHSLDRLTQAGFPRIDLRRALTQARETGPTYMRTDTHWSPHGAQAAAQEIAQAVATVGDQQFETVVTQTGFDGDLMRFVQTGPWSPWVGIPPERILQPQTNSIGGGLFDAPQIGAVLIGTSFSARAEFNFDGALKTALGVDVVTLAEEGQGPLPPMTKALDTDALTQIAPKIVIWEIPERHISSHVRTPQ